MLLRLQRDVSDQLGCCKQPRLLRTPHGRCRFRAVSGSNHTAPTARTRTRLVDRVVKIVIEGKSYRMDRSVRRARDCHDRRRTRNEAIGPWQAGDRISPHPVEGLQAVLVRFSPGAGPNVPQKLADRATAASLSPRSLSRVTRSVVPRYHRPKLRRTRPRSVVVGFKRCLRLESDGTEYQKTRRSGRSGLIQRSPRFTT